MKQQYADSIAAVIRPLAPGARLFDADVALIDQIAGQWEARRPNGDIQQAAEAVETIRLNARMAAEIVGHEAIVREWYLDNAKPPVGTWGIGVTNASGHNVDRYKDNPQTIERCLEIYIWLLNTNYIPDVRKAFAGCKLTEAQFAAATSWHYNTGAILRTDWVKLYKDGKPRAAREFLLGHYLNGGDLEERRKKEAALFFDGEWSGDGTTNLWPVRKPSYRPDWSKPARIDVLPMLQAMLDPPAPNPR